MRTKVILSLLSLGLLGAGCGESSYFEVSVSVMNGLPFVDCVSKVSVCQVNVSGADSATFSLSNICSGPTALNLGKFQYTTEKESGNVMFHLELRDGSGKKLGEGDASSPIKAGGIQPVNLVATPDVAAFACS